MSPLIALTLSTALAQASPQSAFLPDTVLEPPGAPRVVLLSHGGSDLAALRLHVPLTEGPREAGAGQLLVDLAVRRMEGLSRSVGARVGGERTAWGLAYTVEGAAADLEYLGYLLREAAGPPLRDGDDLGAARRRLLAGIERRSESPAERIAAALRAGAVPEVPHPEGTPAGLSFLNAAGVHDVWRRSHLASAMTLVAVAPVGPEVVLAALGRVGASDEGVAAALDAPAAPEPPLRGPDPLRTWYGRAWTGDGPGDPRSQVVALLLADHLGQRAGAFEVRVELVEQRDRAVLTVIAAASGRSVAAMKRAVEGALDEVLAGLAPDRVRAAAARVRLDYLVAARTPGGLADRVGAAVERTGDPGGAAAFVAALAAISDASLRAYLDGMLARGAHSAEIGP